MKATILIPIICLISALYSCKKNEDSKGGTSAGSSSDKACGDHHGHQLYRDGAGNCYYMDGGKKISVENHECSC